ncbi:hypothetical protein [Hyalangium versicolor]|uniref:hypothetical protein n=1 Tax=Hyalangium versicolor TaxID=2861190 RepID=UPI001CCD6334|nr:hypothetical protein [Hyalangium versicolor]
MRFHFKPWSSLTALSLALSTACTGTDAPDTDSALTTARQAVSDLTVTVDGTASTHDKLLAQINSQPASLDDVIKALGGSTAVGSEVLSDVSGSLAPVDGAASTLSAQALSFTGLRRTLDSATDTVNVCSTFSVRPSLIQVCVVLPPTKSQKDEAAEMREARAKAEQMAALMADLSKRYPDPEKLDPDAFMDKEAAQLEQIATLYCQASGLPVPCDPSQRGDAKAGSAKVLAEAKWWSWLKDAFSRVGVIPHATSCPSGFDLLQFYHDDEDRNNANSHSGWLGGISQGSNTLFRFCKVPSYFFHSLVPQGAQYNYSVLHLGLFCPGGTARVSWRQFDDEDRNNQNSYSGSNPFPNVNVLGRNWLMAFCVLDGGPNSFQMSGFNNLGFNYGVFAPTNMPSPYNLQAGSLYMDNEDTVNLNFWINGPGPGMSGTTNTSMGLVRVK